MNLEYPDSPVPLDSLFYIERSPIEERTYQEIQKPGSLVRIKAPHCMGKSSLLVRVIACAQSCRYRTVFIDFQAADEIVFTSLKKFLRWFCANVARQLQLEPLLDDYWDEEVGSKVSATLYFESYLLRAIPDPIILALDEVNRVFEYPNIAKEFLPLLRVWYEQAKLKQRFTQLRIVVTHSTEIYVSLNLNQSPFNVGLPIELPYFTVEQVSELARRHELEWFSLASIQQLMDLVGGHPYLVRVALYHLHRDQIPLAQLLKESPTQSGIYGEHLQRHWQTLCEQPHLGAAVGRLLSATNGVQFEPAIAHKLKSMGLVKIEGNLCQISCRLYSRYFTSLELEEERQKILQQAIAISGELRLKELERENSQLKQLINIDGLTRIANRTYFDTYLHREWHRLSHQESPLSLIFLDVDYFKLYNDTYGHQEGDRCLVKVASVISNCLKQAGDLAARYGGEEFAIVLPEMPESGAIILAEEICSQIKALRLEHINSPINLKVVTASLGVATLIPDSQSEPTMLVSAADRALYASKRQGRDRVTAISLSAR